MRFHPVPTAFPPLFFRLSLINFGEVPKMDLQGIHHHLREKNKNESGAYFSGNLTYPDTDFL
jgi:hypothetical protein